VIAADAPAKTNLFLEVLGKRPDGYHELDTIFVELDLADRLLVTDDAPPGGIIVVAEGDPTVPNGPSNLVWKAADRLRRAVGKPGLGARIVIQKKIPAGGGLGGGSSDAAIALLAVDRLLGLKTGPERLHAIAAEVGSDCAFFLRGGAQRGRGRGEALEALPRPERPLDVVLLFPKIACPTKDVYAALAPHLDGKTRDPRRLIDALANGDIESVGRELWNRLEGPCFQLFPALADEKRALAETGLVATLLSGSGSTLLGLACDREQAESAVAKLRASGRRAVAARAGVQGARP
jgi:4-diphosphocytidyl-2-C-methyl-D-erythritol kinase